MGVPLFLAILATILTVAVGSVLPPPILLFLAVFIATPLTFALWAALFMKILSPKQNVPVIPLTHQQDNSELKSLLVRPRRERPSGLIHTAQNHIDMMKGLSSELKVPKTDQPHHISKVPSCSSSSKVPDVANQTEEFESFSVGIAETDQEKTTEVLKTDQPDHISNVPSYCSSSSIVQDVANQTKAPESFSVGIAETEQGKTKIFIKVGKGAAKKSLLLGTVATDPVNQFIVSPNPWFSELKDSEFDPKKIVAHANATIQSDFNRTNTFPINEELKVSVVIMPRDEEDKSVKRSTNTFLINEKLEACVLISRRQEKDKSDFCPLTLHTKNKFFENVKWMDFGSVPDVTEVYATSRQDKENPSRM
eukprot:GHVT01018667.1.p1 GENE.GHVT01018667.1~~GHVT01018667.1.p1  ORF type:complete len:365 (-),score=31.11 GHVT01018667.1:3463-4557(-)